MYWSIVRENNHTYAKHYVGKRVVLGLCIDTLAKNPALAEGGYENLRDKTWAGEDAASELQSIVDEFRREVV